MIRWLRRLLTGHGRIWGVQVLHMTGDPLDLMSAEGVPEMARHPRKGR